MRTTTILTNEAKRVIVKNKQLRRAIFDRFDILSPDTLQRWLKNNDPRLVHPDTIRLITSYAEMQVADITEVVSLPEAQPAA